jgi:hypothetical protein
MKFKKLFSCIPRGGLSEHKGYVCAVSWALLLFLLHLWTTTRDCSFPFWYHWDEETKAVQVIENERNFNHPLLLVNATAALEKMWRPGTGNRQHVTILGRIVSASFAAAAIGLLAMSAWITFGPLAGLISGLFVLIHPLLFTLSHYFKEDTVLLFGWSSLVFAVALFTRKPEFKTALIMGFASAICVSAKYVGIVPAAGALVLLAACRRNLKTNAIGYATGLVPAVILFNFQITGGMDEALASIGREIQRQFANRTGFGSPLEYVLKDLGIAGSVLLVAGFVQARKLPVRVAAGPVVFAGAASAIYLAILHIPECFVPRYVLPAAVINWWFAGLAMNQLVASSRGKHRFYCLAVFFVFTGVALARFHSYSTARAEFTRPDIRLQFARELEEAARPGDKVMMDFMVNLPGRYAPQRSVAGWTPSASISAVYNCPTENGKGMYETLIDRGFTLAAVNPEYVKRYFNTEIGDRLPIIHKVKVRRGFYKDLRSRGKPVVKLEGAGNSILAPSLSLYRLAMPPE